jgi:HSP20 family protein
METALQDRTCDTNVACQRGEHQPTAASQYVPRFDIVETADEVTLYGDLPGVRPEDLDIRFENQELVVHGKAPARAPQGGEKPRFWGREYGVGDFHRTFAISEGVDAQRIGAELKNGVLTLHLPKAEALKPRKIQVNA